MGISLAKPPKLIKGSGVDDPLRQFLFRFIAVNFTGYTLTENNSFARIVYTIWNSPLNEALAQRAENTTIFAEVDPNQKERIIQAVQRMGRVVGYMEDRVNDAPPVTN
jgi:magnesium-transporting ATPase (P-type)